MLVNHEVASAVSWRQPVRGILNRRPARGRELTELFSGFFLHPFFLVHYPQVVMIPWIDDVAVLAGRIESDQVFIFSDSSVQHAKPVVSFGEAVAAVWQVVDNDPGVNKEWNGLIYFRNDAVQFTWLTAAAI